MKIGIIGCGWLGEKIADHLLNNHQIWTTTTSEEKAKRLSNKGLHSECIIFSESCQNIQTAWQTLPLLDVLIITVPFSSRHQFTAMKNKYQNIQTFIANYTNPIFLMSSIGIYPQEPKTYTENCPTENLNETMLWVERLISQNFPQTNILRLGGLMGDNRKFSKYNITTVLHQRVNHIHYQDIISAIDLLIQKNITGEILNIVAPNHPTKKEIIDYQTQGNFTPNNDFSTPQRLISSEKIQQKYAFKFLKNQPIFF